MATGCSHSFNIAKFRCARTLIRNGCFSSDNLMTPMDICVDEGLKYENVSSLLCRCNKFRKKYFGRIKLPVKGGGRQYGYYITDFGIEMAIKIAKQIDKGFNANFRTISKAECYNEKNALRQKQREESNRILEETGQWIPPEQHKDVEYYLNIPDSELIGYIRLNGHGAREGHSIEDVPKLAGLKLSP